MKFLDKLNNVLDKLYTNEESMIYFYIALGAIAAFLIILIIITSIRIKKTQKKISKSDEVLVETGAPKEETPEIKPEPVEVQTETTIEPIVEPVIEPVVETTKEEPEVPVTEELPEIELPKMNETGEDDISKLINSDAEPEVITDAPISELPTEEPKVEEPKLEQTQTLDELRNRLNNIRQK